jgi:thiamine-monophosphate kinase
VDEFGLIDAFLRPFALARDGRGVRGSGVLAGPGDDCAQLAPTPGLRLVATTDAVLDRVHFDLRRSSPEDAGWKALAVNLSDLAAAGARPRWFLCALGVPRSGSSAAAGSSAEQVARQMGAGMAALARESGIALAGGNVTSAEQWSLTITALGEASRPLTRAGGRPGDLLVAAGSFGAAALGLRILRRAPRRRRAGGPRSRATALGADERACVQAQVRPWPQVAAGLAAAGIARAAIDVSDGLLQDLGHLCARSRCGAQLDCSLLPRHPLVARTEALEAANGAHPYALSLSGGEDYALVLAVAPRRLDVLLSALTSAQVGWSVIGKLTTGRSIQLRERGRRLPLPERRGFDHLAPRQATA